MSDLAGAERRRDVDAVVVGAGFAGLYMVHKLRELGLHVLGIEQAPDVGGTWFWNRYPGARVDIPAGEYCYSFSDKVMQKWRWSERYPSQPEILSYIEKVASSFDLRRHFEFETSVVAASFDRDGSWTVGTDRGWSARCTYLILATGCLSVPRTPDLDGLADFEGTLLHTALWPSDGVDLVDKRVGVIGTGSSGVQIIPEIAKVANELLVFQRTPGFVVPAQNKPLSQDVDLTAVAAHRRSIRGTGSLAALPPQGALDVEEPTRRTKYEELWLEGRLSSWVYAYNDILRDQRANDTVADFIRRKVRETVEDPYLAQALEPDAGPFGTKRPCLGTDYYETFNLPNVHLVDLRKEPLRDIRPGGVRTEGGGYEIDALVVATGFDAMTGAVLGIDIKGVDGMTIQDAWRDGPRTYLGLAVAGFPNMFLITGPGSPSVLSNMVVSIEHHVEWIANCIARVREKHGTRVEATPEAEAVWVRHVNDIAMATLYAKANSWYVGANVPGKPRVFMPYVGGVVPYQALCQEVVDEGYKGFLIHTEAESGVTA